MSGIPRIVQETVAPYPRTIVETVQPIRPAINPVYQYGGPPSRFGATGPARITEPFYDYQVESAVRPDPVRETVMTPGGTAHQVNVETRVYAPNPSIPDPRPDKFKPLDRIHENGHPDITRFTKDELKEFHEYLRRSTEEGRSFSGTGKVNIEDIESIQAETLESLKSGSVESLDTLLLLCELSNLRDERCVLFFTEAGFDEIFTKFIEGVLFSGKYINDQLEHPGLYIGFNLLVDAAQRFTENGVELCRKMGKVAVPLLLELIRDSFFEVEALNRDDEELKWMSRRELLKKIFTLFYNCIRNHPDNRRVFRMSRASAFFEPFLNCRFYILRAKALFILAYIVTEEENADLNTETLNIEFIVKVLRRTLEEPSHYSAHYNFYAVEVVEAVQRVAANDSNKDKFIEAGVLPHLVALMDEKNSREERNTALNAVWVLSFSSKNKDAILNEERCIDNIKACMGIDDFTRICQAILWNLHDQVIPKTEKKEDKDDKPEVKGADDGASADPETERKIAKKQTPHVMLSYQWDVQKQILKVKDVLSALGFNVWLDVERMGGSTLEAMANAVEEACVVIICFSEKYKDSPACRTEAEYTYKLRKPIIPLKMQTGYDPNGWLGAMLGNKFYIQMSTLELVQDNMGLLVRELADRGRTLSTEDQSVDDDEYIPSGLPKLARPMSPPYLVPENRTLPPPSPPIFPQRQRVERIVTRQDSNPYRVYSPPPTAVIMSPQIRRDGAVCLQLVQRWNSQEVVAWLGHNNLNHLSNWLQGYNGEDLVGLKKISTQAPEFFFGKLEREFGFKSLLDMIRFKKMLDDIV
ncbi:uncharacterized protein LOC121422047 isoform X2 [Lytechinus variegatus]|uniref:uncharacterized protein LOC121422047 isoform X2 n=1 Tax=Lytechinus variegatus TaxID=7654 RepID=UPI001BB23E69|nr:uncharacterized protein LOC121422047 isoform X2 [Lytechinus variegatus]